MRKYNATPPSIVHTGKTGCTKKGYLVIINSSKCINVGQISVIAQTRCGITKQTYMKWK